MLVIFPSKSPLVPVASVGCANTASLGVWLPKLSPDAARNATGATFAWGPFRPLDFSGPRTPPEFGPPPEDHSQLVCGYRLLMGRRYSPRNSRVQAPVGTRPAQIRGEGHAKATEERPWHLAGWRSAARQPCPPASFRRRPWEEPRRTPTPWRPRGATAAPASAAYSGPARLSAAAAC